MSKKYIFILIISIFISFILIFLISISRESHKKKLAIDKLVEYNINLCNTFENTSPMDIDASDALNNSISDLTQLKEFTDNSNAISLIDTNIELNKLSLNLLSSNDFQSIIDYNNSSSELLSELNELEKYGYNSDIYREFAEYKKNILDSNLKNTIKISQNNEFKNNIASCLKSLQEISEDLRPALNSIRSDGRSLNVLLKDIKDKKASLYKIQTKISTFTVPEDCALYYQEFSRLVNFYKSYLISIENSVNMEISNCNDSELSKNYQESFQKYDDFNSSLSEFSIDDLKWFCPNIDILGAKRIINFILVILFSDWDTNWRNSMKKYILFLIICITLSVLLCKNTDVNAYTIQNKSETKTDIDSEKIVDVFNYGQQNLYITQSDVDLMAKLVYAESRGEPFEGKIAVASVVLNRVLNPEFPKSIKDVILQPKAFSCVTGNTIVAYPNQDCYNAVYDAISGKDPSNRAIYFYNPELSTCVWMHSAEKNDVVKIGHHVFFKSND